MFFKPRFKPWAMEIATEDNGFNHFYSLGCGPNQTLETSGQEPERIMLLPALGQRDMLDQLKKLIN